ncbi:hypothetical protein WJX73_009535 [Symbiochloris irregularis]|uniref:Uncharacterized protein n=1 Tax=Symbiochloris irregularis TaxID=706552 RepID=A0AAW1PQE1_9CHLO
MARRPQDTLESATEQSSAIRTSASLHEQAQAYRGLARFATQQAYGRKAGALQPEAEELLRGTAGHALQGLAAAQVSSSVLPAAVLFICKALPDARGRGSTLHGMTPLYGATRGAAATAISTSPPHAASHRLSQLADVAASALARDSLQLRAAGALAAGGLLEGIADKAACIWRDAAALSYMQALPRAKPQVAAFQCMLGCLLDSALSLQPLFTAAEAHAAPGAASAQLHALADSSVMQAAPTLARLVGEHYRAMPIAVQQDAQLVLAAFAQALARDYSAYISCTPPEWLQAVDTNAIRQACHLLSQQLPCYADLATAAAPAAKPIWLADSVLASRVHFLLGILVPCAARLDQAAVEQVAPVALLYLQHWHAPVTTAAHALCTALVQHAAEGQRLVPMYVARSLEAFPQATPLSALSVGMDALARALPPGSPLMLLCTQRISERLLHLLSTPDSPPPHLSSALHLAKLLAHILTVADLQVLPDIMAQAETCVHSCRQEHRSAVCSAMLQIIGASNDYTRKLTPNDRPPKREGGRGCLPSHSSAGFLG